MGGNQSRVEASDVETEIKNHGERQGEATASINLTPALVAQLNDKSPAEPAAAQRHAVTLTPEQEAFVKKQVQDAYLKGASDFRKDLEAKQKKQAESAPAAVDPTKQAQHAKELEAKENARVQRLVDEINRKKYRAPLNDVQCSPERDACLQCYRDKQSDILQCKEVADAFIRCSQQTTEQFVKDN
uniref:CHCH domain-containing protein n=1 Tax=Globisporangium ultimum (strain ATCC 200006 / CBS 805.95 / DAOM BR144) TaxID=431595 RepID=K3WID2_GLOUD